MLIFSILRTFSAIRRFIASRKKCESSAENCENLRENAENIKMRNCAELCENMKNENKKNADRIISGAGKNMWSISEGGKGKYGGNVGEMRPNGEQCRGMR